MKPTTSRTERQLHLLELSPDLFETYFDYYIFIHLNRDVQILHVIGMLLGFTFLALAVIKWSWIYLVLHLITFNMIPLVSHWIYDGIMTPTASGAKIISIWYAIRLNVWFMTGQQDRKEREFIEKYPFTEKYFRA